MKEQIKLQLPKQIEDFFQVYAKPINGKYVFFPNVYKKLGENMWEEIKIADLPEGLKKYIKEELKLG